MRIQTILHPTDYSDRSRLATEYAVELARVHQARLIVLHTVDTLGPENATFGEVLSQRQPDSYRQRLWDELHHVVPPDSGIPVEFVLSEDDPVSAIVRTAVEHHCDLIVLASHGRRGLQRLVEGSIAEHVMRAATCPVLVVKLPVLAAEAHPKPGTEMHPHVLFEGGA